MYIISECVACVVLVLTLSAFLVAFSVVLLTIRSGFGSRRRTSRQIQNGGLHIFARPAFIKVRHRPFEQ
jgi:hypothetical protein